MGESCGSIDAAFTIGAVLATEEIRELLLPFGLELTPDQLGLLRTYLDLLVRWNRRINLTAIRDPEECVTRHFGESLYLARCCELRGRLLDIGSGAGFPGLALKIAFPALSVTLLEPIAKKRAFLKEVARECGFDAVEVRSERLGDFVRQQPSPEFDSATARAVGRLDELVQLTPQCLKPQGRLFLWLSRAQGNVLAKERGNWQWGDPISIPLSRQGEIWSGIKML